MPPAIFEPVHFEKEDRVRLWFKVLDLLPPGGDAYAEVNHRGMYWLDDILKRVLGRLTLATGYTEQQRIETFIMSAPEREILDLIKLVPLARCAAHAEYIEGRQFSRDHKDAIQLEACAELNSFLETTRSPARFNNNGVFVPEQFAPDVPVALSKLPRKDQLRGDLEMRCGEKSPTAAVFVDLDNFKLVNDSKDIRQVMHV